MKIVVNEGVFRCTNYRCTKRSKVSLRVGTFFYGSRLNCQQIMALAMLWLHKVSVVSAISLSGHSSTTVSSFYKHFRHLVESSLIETDQMIGGPSVTVEIDETKLGKRKYHRGHPVEGVWVVAGIERIPNGRIFLIPVKDRSAITLRSVVSTHVREGTHVITDCWKGYLDLEDFGLTHETVNHSQFFKDPETGACTNTVEGLNNGLKTRISPRNRCEDTIPGHLGEHIWRRHNSTRLFDAFVDALRDMHYELSE